MTDKKNNNTLSTTYTCNEYRQEMVLLALQMRLRKPDLSAEEKKTLQREIAILEKEMDL